VTKRDGFDPTIERFLWQHVWTKLPFDVIAQKAAEKFGAQAPSPDDTASFLCAVGRGKCYLDRFRRDRVMARWLLENCTIGTVKEIRAVCLRHFGAPRTPSEKQMAEFLHRAGWRWWNDRKRHPGRIDGEVAAWIAAHAAESTLDELRLACTARFGAAHTPSRSVLHRHLNREGLASAGRQGNLEADGAAMDWLRRAANELPLTRLSRAMAQGFGADRARSRSAIHRQLAKLPNLPRRARLRVLGRVPDVAAWLAERGTAGTLDDLRSECVAAFGADRTPSRSAIHRFIQCLRNSGL
jgi:hypothetical protein